MIQKRTLGLLAACGLSASALAAETTAAPAPVSAVGKDEIAALPERSLVESLGDSFVDTLKKGKVSGTIGTYWERVWYDEPDYEDGAQVAPGVPQNRGNRNYGWGTGYLSLGYKSADFHGFTFGAEFLGHFKLRHDESTRNGVGTDHYQADIEDGAEFSMPQVWVQYGFTDDTKVVAGRWEHVDFTHFDDVQAEGAYFRTGEINDLLPESLIKDIDLTIGFATKFAELDYDDGEDWDKESQDFSEDRYYGKDSSDYVLFSELVIDVADYLTANPYVYWQDDYAAVYGLDFDAHAKAADDVTVGTRTSTYWVEATDREYLTGTPQAVYTRQSDAFCWAVAPYVEVGTEYGDFEVQAGYAVFDGESDRSALNKPEWLRDYIVDVLDQDRLYGAQDCEVLFGKIKWSYGKFWTHYAVGYYHSIYRGATADDGRVTENEIQLGYKITKNIDVNLRLFDVDYDYESNSLNNDYQKVEFRGRIRF